MPLCPIKSQSLENLQAQLHDWGEPAYRATQVVEWLYTRRAPGWDAMTNLPRRLRERLAQHYAFTTLELVAQQGSADATRKFLWRLDDRALIESVLIPASPTAPGADEETSRQTLCISTQVGCAYGCAFCASGLGGFKRNLGADEIVEQVLAAQRRSVDNLVVMGMGELLANYDNLIRACILAPWRQHRRPQNHCVHQRPLPPDSTPGRRAIAVPARHLLHGAITARNRLMPINHKHPPMISSPPRGHQTIKGRLITLDILISGVNDGLDQTRLRAPSPDAFTQRSISSVQSRRRSLAKAPQPRQELFLAASKGMASRPCPAVSAVTTSTPPAVNSGSAPNRTGRALRRRHASIALIPARPISSARMSAPR